MIKVSFIISAVGSFMMGPSALLHLPKTTITLVLIGLFINGIGYGTLLFLGNLQVINIAKTEMGG